MSPSGQRGAAPGPGQKVLVNPKHEQALDKITDVSVEIDEALAFLEELYQKRDAAYIAAQEAGATIAAMADRAGVTIQGVKYMLAKAKKR